VGLHNEADFVKLFVVWWWEFRNLSVVLNLMRGD
jgi:hypothetical protein